MQGILVCEICQEKIGTFNPETIRLPITSDQFGSIDEFHGFPPPFPIIPGRMETMTWEAARCPFCRRRPFIFEDKILTPNGHFHIGKDATPPRKRTLDDERQDEINRAWSEVEAEGSKELPLSLRNQALIAKLWSEHTEAEAQAEALQSADRILDEAANIRSSRKGRNRKRR